MLSTRPLTLLILLFTSLSAATACRGGTTNTNTTSGSTGIAAPEIVLENAAVIEGVINNNLGAVTNKMLSFDPAKGSFDLVISSPGGSVMTGSQFINQMEAVKGRGVNIRCFVVDMAASMAFSILVHCNERYTLTHAFLLWHRARIMSGGLGGSPTTAETARTDAVQLQLVDDLILHEVLDSMPDADESAIKWHFEKETLHNGYSLHLFSPSFITPFESIPGLLDVMLDKKVPRSTRGGIFDIFSVGIRQIFYIAPNYPVVLDTNSNNNN